MRATRDHNLMQRYEIMNLDFLPLPMLAENVEFHLRLRVGLKFNKKEMEYFGHADGGFIPSIH